MRGRVLARREETCFAGLSTTFVNNLCVAQSRAISGAVIDATGLNLGMPAAGDCPLIANNIIDASGTVGTVRAFKHTDGSPIHNDCFRLFNNNLVNDCFRLFNNNLVPRGLTCPAVLYLLPVDYVAPNVSNPTASGYHLAPSCTLHDLGTPITGVTTDYDNQTRSTTTPTIGPDECQAGP